MNVLLLHLDGRLPNLALMRLAAHHRAAGDTVELRRISVSCVEPKALKKALQNVEPWLGDPIWDRVYASAIFETTRPLVARTREVYPSAAIGGTGVSVTSNLSDVGVNDRGPVDYADYPSFKQSMGFSMRGCRLRCEFCVVPKKEGKARGNATLEEIWRGADHPRQILLLDNDFFGYPGWRAFLDAARVGKFKVSFTQGINARMLNDRTAAAIASVDYRDDQMDRKRIYTAWDSKDDEGTLFRGLEALVRHGVKPDHIMVYMLIGYWDGESHADRELRRTKLRAFGARPYPMPFIRADDPIDVRRYLKGYQKFVVQRWDLHTSWNAWSAARYEPRNLMLKTKGRVSLPLFKDDGS